MTLRSATAVRLLLTAALLGGVVAAAPARVPPGPVPAPAGFARTQVVLDAARGVTLRLRAGAVVVTPRGERVVLLTAAGRGVAWVLLRPDGTLAVPGGPVGGGRQVALAAAGRAALDARIAALTVSGAVQVTPGEYRVPLLSGGVMVAALHLDRVTLRALAPRARPAPGRGPGPRGRGGG